MPKTKFASSEQLLEINEDRRRIIEIIQFLLKSGKYKSRPHILQNLNYPKLPTHPKNVAEISKMTMHRILHPEEFNWNGNSCSGILYSEFLAHINERFKKDLQIEKASTNAVNEFLSSFDLFFLFHYWAETAEVRTALLGIVLENLTASKFCYFKNDTNRMDIEKILDIKSLTYESSGTMDIVLSSRTKTGPTFISAHLGNKEITEINVAFCSYCGAIGVNQKPYSGLGLLQKISIKNFENEMEQIRKGVPSNVINALYKRRLESSISENEVYDSIDKINIVQKEPLKLVNGLWIGYFLRSKIDVPGESESGGIVKALMDVEESGIATLYFKESDDLTVQDLIIYKGGFNFSIPNTGTITIGEFQNQSNVNSLIMHLKPDAKYLKGVCTGWRSSDFGYFTSPIHFTKFSPNTDENESKENLINRLILELIPARYHRSKKGRFIQEIEELKKVQEKTFDTVQFCIG